MWLRKFSTVVRLDSRKERALLEQVPACLSKLTRFLRRETRHPSVGGEVRVQVLGLGRDLNRVCDASPGYDAPPFELHLDVFVALDIDTPHRQRRRRD